MFSQIAERKSAVQLCEDELKTAILKGQFQVGDQLPPEREMAEMFGLNRLTIRTALARLAAQGLLSVRQGRGYRVENYRTAGGPQLLASLIELASSQGQRLEMIEDLLRIRRHLARGILEKIADQPRTELTGLDHAIEEFAATVERGGSIAELAQADMNVLSALIGLIDSPVYGLCLHPIQQVVLELPSCPKRFTES